jgi:nucleotide-binding universal stress UspA family protein
VDERIAVVFSHILVPLDGTAQSNAALPLARTVAQATGGAITLMRVVPEDSGTTTRQVNDELERIAMELTASVPEVKAVVRQSRDVAHEILAQIAEQSADLVVMRTHGRSGVGRAVLGSVTQHVLANGRVPVMLLRPGGRRVTRIGKLLVPVDGSPGGTLALGLGVQLSRATAASIQLLEVAVPLTSVVYAGYGYGGMTYYDPAWDEEALSSARTYVQGLVARLRAANLKAEGEACQGPLVAEAVVSAADAANADIIVMSTRALIGPARAVLGSTADAVVRTAHCPVLLVHRSDAARDATEEVLPALSI